MKIAIVTLGWHSVTQRPHHWADSAVRFGHDVDIITVGRPIHSYFRRNKRPSRHNVISMPKNLTEILLFKLGFADAAKNHLFSRFAKYVDKILSRRTKSYDLVIIASEPFPLSTHSHSAKFVYDCMDDWEFFPGVQQSLLQSEQLLANSADFISVVSQSLYNKFERTYGFNKLMLVPNGCDYEHFSTKIRARNQDNRIVIGYTGMIMEWFDWNVVIHLACTIPNVIVRLVGPYKNLPVDLPRNIEILGRQPYEKMPEYNAVCDVCIIPFKSDDELVRSVSPIKLYEYLASGCPVVSAPMDDVCQLAEDGVVHLAKTLAEFTDGVILAAALSWDEDLINKRRRVAQDHSWDSRLKNILMRSQDI